MDYFAYGATFCSTFLCVLLLIKIYTDYGKKPFYSQYHRKKHHPKKLDSISYSGCPDHAARSPVPDRHRNAELTPKNDQSNNKIKYNSIVDDECKRPIGGLKDAVVRNNILSTNLYGDKNSALQNTLKNTSLLNEETYFLEKVIEANEIDNIFSKLPSFYSDLQLACDNANDNQLLMRTKRINTKYFTLEELDNARIKFNLSVKPDRKTEIEILAIFNVFKGKYYNKVQKILKEHKFKGGLHFNLYPVRINNLPKNFRVGTFNNLIIGVSVSDPHYNRNCSTKFSDEAIIIEIIGVGGVYMVNGDDPVVKVGAYQPEYDFLYEESSEELNLEDDGKGQISSTSIAISTNERLGTEIWDICKTIDQS